MEGGESYYIMLRIGGGGKGWLSRKNHVFLVKGPRCVDNQTLVSQSEPLSDWKGACFPDPILMEPGGIHWEKSFLWLNDGARL